VSSYTIIITPNDDTATTTRLELEISGNQVVLTDLHIHASNGLSAGRLPAIDYDLLLRAISPLTPTPTSTRLAPATNSHAQLATSAAEESAIEVDESSAPSTPRARRRSAAAGSVRPVKTGQRRRGRATAVEPDAVPATATRRGRKPAAATNGIVADGVGAAGRAYRRMPEDFAVMYEQAGSATALANQYDVPRHTVHGWVKRLRAQGVLPTE
jgi:hypothetical protein